MERCISLTRKQGLCCRDGRKLTVVGIILQPMKRFHSRLGYGRCLVIVAWENGFMSSWDIGVMGLCMLMEEHLTGKEYTSRDYERKMFRNVFSHYHFWRNKNEMIRVPKGSNFFVV